MMARPSGSKRHSAGLSEARCVPSTARDSSGISVICVWNILAECFVHLGEAARTTVVYSTAEESMGQFVAEGRKYHLDWLRVLAFGLLIPFHVGMLYNSWSYPLKSPRLVPELDWLLMLSTPWRLALVFLISGVASRFLITKLGPGPFARDRVRRLLPVILFGMLVVNAPQTWIVATANGMTHSGIGEFWRAYLHNDQSVLKPPGMTMPRWDHLWFLSSLVPAVSIAVCFVICALAEAQGRAPDAPAAVGRAFACPGNLAGGYQHAGG
jgi:hypothetical protein